MANKRSWEAVGGYDKWYEIHKASELPRLQKYINPTKQMLFELEGLYGDAGVNRFRESDKVRQILVENQVAGYDIRGLLNTEKYLFIVEDIAEELIQRGSDVGYNIPEMKEISEIETVKRGRIERKQPKKDIKVVTKIGKVYYRSKSVRVTDGEKYIISLYQKEKYDLRVDRKLKEYYQEYMKLDGRYDFPSRTFKSFSTIWYRTKRKKGD